MFVKTKLKTGEKHSSKPAPKNANFVKNTQDPDSDPDPRRLTTPPSPCTNYNLQDFLIQEYHYGNVLTIFSHHYSSCILKQ
jgi:hypothetical protein